jgi:hypothetical protein
MHSYTVHVSCLYIDSLLFYNGKVWILQQFGGLVIFSLDAHTFLEEKSHSSFRESTMSKFCVKLLAWFINGYN